jgi:hypothetical protein
MGGQCNEKGIKVANNKSLTMYEKTISFENARKEEKESSTRVDFSLLYESEPSTEALSQLFGCRDTGCQQRANLSAWP